MFGVNHCFHPYESPPSYECVAILVLHHMANTYIYAYVGPTVFLKGMVLELNGHMQVKTALSSRVLPYVLRASFWFFSDIHTCVLHS